MTELLVLGGERVAAAEGATTEVVEPSTGKPAWDVAQASAEDARRAVDVAVDAFETGPVASHECSGAGSHPHEGLVPDPRPPGGARDARGS